MNKRESGFTLTELMIVIALMSIMAAIAFPSMSRFVNSTRTLNRTEQVANLFRFAKGEAVRLNTPVVICGVKIRSDGRALGNCNANDIPSGLRAYADTNRNGKYDTGVDLDLRTISLNGEISNSKPAKIDVKPVAYTISGTAATNPSGQFIFMPNGTFGLKKNTDSLVDLSLNSHYVAFQLTPTQNNKIEKENRRILSINPIGNIAICNKTNQSQTKAFVCQPST